MTVAPAPVLARNVVRGLRRVGLLSNLAGAALIFIAIGLIGSDQDIPEGRMPELVGVLVVMSAIAFPSVSYYLTRRGQPMLAAIREGRPLLGAERHLVFTTPWINAIASLCAWVAAAVLFPVHSLLRLEATGGEAVLLALALVLSGLTTMAVVYLLAERVMRPVVELAFAAEGPSGVRGLPIRPRLLLSWLLGGGVPLLLISLAMASPDADLSVGTLRLQAGVMVPAGLVAGGLIMLRTARSVSDPLVRIREAMTDVSRGRLDVRSPVDDASEIGLMQAGFNQMVAGLEERERMRDLFGRHVGEEVARRALEGGVSLGGEVREASALFVDLTGSTALAASHAPEQIVEMLNMFFAGVVAATEAEGGWVNKFEGDAALCVFGVPVHEADHATRALRAARRVRDAVRALSSRYPDLDADVGVSAGPVVAGNVGAKERFEYTVIGDPVNEAARLTDAAKTHATRVLASEAVVERASAHERENWHADARLSLRGRPEPTATYVPNDDKFRAGVPPSS